MEKQTHGSKIHCRISTEEGGSKQWFSVDSCKNNQEREDEAVGTQDGPGRSFLNWMARLENESENSANQKKRVSSDPCLNSGMNKQAWLWSVSTNIDQFLWNCECKERAVSHEWLRGNSLRRYRFTVILGGKLVVFSRYIYTLRDSQIHKGTFAKRWLVSRLRLYMTRKIQQNQWDSWMLFLQVKSRGEVNYQKMLIEAEVYLKKTW